jgi:hypothetical protein
MGILSSIEIVADVEEPTQNAIPVAMVIDNAGMLSDAEEEELLGRLQRVWDRTGFSVFLMSTDFEPRYDGQLDEALYQSVLEEGFLERIPGSTVVSLAIGTNVYGDYEQTYMILGTYEDGFIFEEEWLQEVMAYSMETTTTWYDYFNEIVLEFLENS